MVLFRFAMASSRSDTLFLYMGILVLSVVSVVCSESCMGVRLVSCILVLVGLYSVAISCNTCSAVLKLAAFLLCPVSDVDLVVDIVLVFR